VPGLISKIKRWLGGSSSMLSGPIPFAVQCNCGRSVEGVREVSHQVVPCPHCGAHVFVLPRSPLPEVLLPRPKKKTPAVPANQRRWLVAAGIGFSFLATAGLIWWFGFRDAGPAQNSDNRSEAVGPLIRQAEKALARGHAATARQALDRVLRPGNQLTGVERRRLAQLRRQASLAADLLEVSLHEVVGTADELPFGEWQAVFRERYQGRAVIFDTRVRRDASGKLSLDYRVFVGQRQARVEIGDLALLKQLQLDQPQRLIVGGRLAAVERTGEGPWVVRFQAESGVLMTHQPLVERLCPALDNDPDAAKTLQRQAAWLEELP
jgi:hypothetical protein